MSFPTHNQATPMHTPPPLPFNPNAHHFNSAMNNVGFGFGGAGGRGMMITFPPSTPMPATSSSSSSSTSTSFQQQQQLHQQSQGMGFARFGSGGQAAGGTGFGFGFGVGGGRSTLSTSTTTTTNPATSSSSSSASTSTSGSTSTSSFIPQSLHTHQPPQPQAQTQIQTQGRNHDPEHPRPGLYHHPTAPNLTPLPSITSELGSTHAGSITTGAGTGTRAGLASISMVGRLAGHPPTSNSNLNSISGAGSTSRKKRTRSTSPTNDPDGYPATTLQAVNQGAQRSTGKRSREEPGSIGRERGGIRGGVEDQDEDELDELDDDRGTTRRRRTSVDGPRGKRMRRDGSGDPGKKSGARSRSRIGLLGQGGVQEERDENDDDGDDDDDEDEQAEDEEDVGVLLASIPTSSLLPLIHSLLQARPSLKSLLTELIPTPEIDDVLGVIKDRARGVVGSVPLGMAEDGLVGVRVRTSLAEFCKAAMTYLPRFIIEEPFMGFRTGRNDNTTNLTKDATRNRNINDLNMTMTTDNDNTTRNNTTTTTTTPRRLPVHPTIPPTLLVPLSQTILGTIFPVLPSRLLVHENTSFDQLEALCDKVLRGWTTWVKVLGKTVNEQGGMFSSGVVKAWETGLDELAQYHLQRQQQVQQQQQQQQLQTKEKSRGKQELTIANLEKRFGEGLKTVRDEWVDSVGWMVGRSRPVEGFEGAAGEDVRMG